MQKYAQSPFKAQESQIIGGKESRIRVRYGASSSEEEEEEEEEDDDEEGSEQDEGSASASEEEASGVPPRK